MPFCHLHKNAAHFSQLWMRAIFGPKCKFIRYFVHSVLGQRARKYTQYMIRISPIENYEDFLKLVSQTSRSDSSFFVGIHAALKFNLRNRLVWNLPEWRFFLAVVVSYWFPFIELSYLTGQTAFTVANAEFLIWSTFFLNSFYSLFARFDTDRQHRFIEPI